MKIDKQKKSDLSKMVKYHNRSRNIAAFAFLFWLTETIIFLFIYGWHWKSIGVEEYFDTVVIGLYFLSAFFWIKVVNVIIKAILVAIKEE